MSFLDTLMARYGDVIEPPVTPTATDSIPHDRFDEATWGEVRADVPAIDHAITELSVKHDYVDDFAQDTYNLMVKGDPTVRPDQDMRSTHVPNRTMIDGFAQMPEIQRLRTLTANDPYGAAMAFVSMKDKLTHAAESMSEAREKAAEAEAARQESEKAVTEALEALARAQEAEAAVDPDDVDGCFDAAQQQQQAQEALEAAEQAGGCALGARQDAAQAAQDALAGMRAEVRMAADQAADERRAEQELFAAFGVEDGELKRMSFAERAVLAKRLTNNRMAKFTRLIGAFKQMSAASSRRKVRHVAEEVVGVKLGDDLQRLTMTEMVNMSVPELEDDFWLRYVQRELLVYDLTGTERMGQGPIVVVCDESASMEQGNLPGGTPEAWSKAFTLALLDTARRQGRDFHYIGFSNENQQWCQSFPLGRGPVDKVIELCEHFFHGGTHYEKPLSMALDIVEHDYADRNLPKPDIVFITDERTGSLDQEFMARWRNTKARLSLRCFGIAMVPTINGALKAIADDVRIITELTADPQHVADVMRMI